MTIGEDRVIDRVVELSSVVNARPDLLRRGRYLKTTFLLGIGEVPVYVGVDGGRISSVECGPFLLRPWSFAIRATKKAWLYHWEPKPPPGYHDIFAMAKLGEARIEGDLAPLMRNLQYIKDVVAAPGYCGSNKA